MLRTALTVILIGLLAVTCGAAGAEMTLAANGQTDYTIVVDPDATLAEKRAAAELQTFLGQVTGAEYPLLETGAVDIERAIVVGPDLAAKVAPDLDIDGLGADGIIIETRGERLILAGDRPRGTLYAVYEFLESEAGIRWWAVNATHIPAKPTLVIPDLHVRYVPTLEYRETFWYDAFADKDWAVRNKNNGKQTRLDEVHGGNVSYVGNFVHTFAQLVNPAEHFEAHPEWFAFIDGERRTNDNAQRTGLCLTNPELKDFLVERVFEWIEEHPEGEIISVSQNDSRVYCHCDECTALEQAEGSPMGPLLAAVNYVAEKVAERYPDVAVDTLAYQYTRPATATIKPLPNVIIRLCSIECSFLHPLSAPENSTFGDDIRAWSKLSDRLYIWDYTTNFSHYLLPHPNLRVLGPNIRFFVDHGVKGVFEQGAYHSYGAEFAPLRSWVIAKLLWNPDLDDGALIEEFVNGYYGAAAPPIMEYITLLHDTADEWGGYMHYAQQPNAPFLTLDLLVEAERLFTQAEALVADDPDVLPRVQVAHLPIRYVWARRWFDLEREAALTGVEWPLSHDPNVNAEEFFRVAAENGVTAIGEGRGIETLKLRMADIGRVASGPPPGCEDLEFGEYIDMQDSSFRLAHEGEWAELKHDDLASDKAAARMGGHHHEWAVQQPTSIRGLDTDATWKVYASIRCEKKGEEGGAFTFGVYDVQNKVTVGYGGVACADVDGQYQTYEIMTGSLSEQMYIYVAPAMNPDNIEAVWVDRIWIVKQ